MRFDDGPYTVQERECAVPTGGGSWPGSYRRWWVVLNRNGGVEYYAPSRGVAERVRTEKAAGRPVKEERHGR